VRSKSWECHRRKGGCTWTLRTVDTLVEALTHPHGVGTLERRIPLNVPLAPRAVPAAPPKPPRPTPAQSTSAVAEAVGSLACPRWPGGGDCPRSHPGESTEAGTVPLLSEGAASCLPSTTPPFMTMPALPLPFA
jgi:hypothetical protein